MAHHEAMPFSLVYEMETVLPFEVEVPSLRILVESGLMESEWAQARLDQLNLIEGKRLAAMSHERFYQKWVKNAFDKKVRSCRFSEGDLVLKKVSQALKDNRGKWTPSYEGPFIVKKAFSRGALVLTNMDDEELPSPVNSFINSYIYSSLFWAFEKFSQHSSFRRVHTFFFGKTFVSRLVNPLFFQRKAKSYFIPKTCLLLVNQSIFIYYIIIIIYYYDKVDICDHIYIYIFSFLKSRANEGTHGLPTSNHKVNGKNAMISCNEK